MRRGKYVWTPCAKCGKPSIEGDHEFCDEPTYQQCAGCKDPVHLNHVEYTGKTLTPWCPSCNTPEKHWLRACLAVWRRQQRRHPDRFTGPRDMRASHDPLYLAVSHAHTHAFESTIWPTPDREE